MGQIIANTPLAVAKSKGVAARLSGRDFSDADVARAARAPLVEDGQELLGDDGRVPLPPAGTIPFIDPEPLYFIDFSCQKLAFIQAVAVGYLGRGHRSSTPIETTPMLALDARAALRGPEKTLWRLARRCDARHGAHGRSTEMRGADHRAFGSRGGGGDHGQPPTKLPTRSNLSALREFLPPRVHK
jgi:hypothetical protein